MRPTRRSLLQSGAAAIVAPTANTLIGLTNPAGVGAQEAAKEAAKDVGQAAGWRHGLSLFDDLKYPPGFKHFDYVNVNAPKGGVARQITFGTFDNFNAVVSGEIGRAHV